MIKVPPGSIVPLVAFTLLLIAACSAGRSLDTSPTTVEAPTASPTRISTATSGPVRTPEPMATPASVVIDNCGFDIEVDEPPQRVFAMFHGAIELAMALGASDRIIGHAFLDNQLLEELPALPPQTPYFERYPSKEDLLALEPDFVFASFDAAYIDEHFGSREALADVGIGTWVFYDYCPGTDVGTTALESTYREILGAGRLFHREEAAAALVKEMRAQIEAVRTAVADETDRPVVVALEKFGDALWSWGGETVIYELIEVAGGQNAFEDIALKERDISIEQIIARNPDALIVTMCCGENRTRADSQPLVDAFKADPALVDVTAIIEDRILILDFAEMSISVRNSQTAEEIARFLHPDAFAK